jgi:hypothetical protein
MKIVLKNLVVLAILVFLQVTKRNVS